MAGKRDGSGRLRVWGHHLAAAAMPTALAELRTPAYAMELSVIKANAARMLATADRLGEASVTTGPEGRGS